MKKMAYMSVISLCAMAAVACHGEEETKAIPPEPEPEAVAVEGKRAALWDITKRVGEDESAERNLYSAEYMLEVAGMPYSVSDSWTEGMEKSGLILLSSPVADNAFLPEEVEKLEAWVRAGGILVAPAVTGNGDVLTRLFGISGSQRTKSRLELNFTDNQRELSYIDEPEEKSVPLGKGEGNCIYTYGYEVTSGDALARFDTGEAAMVRNAVGDGRAYTFGVKWRDVIQRSQLNKDFGASRAYSNGLECLGDIFPLVLRGIYAAVGPVSVWKHTVPGDKLTVLVPTHDCDSRTAYEAMHFMSEYEKGLGVSGHYFLTVHYYRDPGYLSAFYDETSIEASKALLNDGHTVGSHSIGHFPDFNNTERFPLTEVTREEYASAASHDVTTGVTAGGSTWAEVVLSKRIIEGDLGNQVRSFRSGHLCVNKNIPEAMRMGGYSFSSCYSAGDVLTSFPFRERTGNDWSGEFNGVLQIPLHLSDVFSGDDKMDENNWQEKPEIWLTTLNKLAGNYAPAVVLIHPNREWKMEAEKMLVEQLDRSNVGVCNFEAYGDFWNARRDFDFEYSYIPGEQKVVVRAKGVMPGAGVGISFGIETVEAEVKEAVLVDGQNVETKLRLKQIAGNRQLAISNCD